MADTPGGDRRSLHRRHLSESQRAMVGATLKPMYEVEARARMTAGANQYSPVANLPEGSNARSRDQAAAAVNVSPRSVESVARVLEKGAPELVAAHDVGGQLRVVAADDRRAVWLAIGEPVRRLGGWRRRHAADRRGVHGVGRAVALDGAFGYLAFSAR